MIQPNELRIGNYIQKHGVWLRVVAITDYSAKKTISAFSEKMDCYELSPQDYQPIKLTSYILIKAGFKESDRFKDDDYTTYEIGDEDLFLEIDWRRKENGFVPQVMANELVAIGCNIKYVHQLQNTFYSLFQIELKIQL